MLCLVATVVSVFATVDYEDAITEARWVSARGLVHPKPGSLYILKEEGLHGRPVCRLDVSENYLVGRGETREYRFRNVVGYLMPFLAKINILILGSKTDELESQSTAPFSLVWVADEVYVSTFRGVPMDKNCEKDFHDALEAGATICAVDRAILSPGKSGTVYAVGFKNTCASACAEGETDCVAPRFEPESTTSWNTVLKKEMGLIRLDKTAIQQ